MLRCHRHIVTITLTLLSPYFTLSPFAAITAITPLFRRHVSHFALLHLPPHAAAPYDDTLSPLFSLLLT